jgi:transcriptional regulator with XRE-family HTH domain
MRIFNHCNAHIANPMSDESREIGRKLKIAIKQRGLSQADVATKLCVSQPRVSRVLAGDFTPRSKLVRRLCEQFDVDLTYAHISEAERAFETATDRLRLLWDGTSSGAERLDALLDAVRSIRPADQSTKRPAA